MTHVPEEKVGAADGGPMTFEPGSLANKAAMNGAEMSFNQKGGVLASGGAYGATKVDSSFH